MLFRSHALGHWYLDLKTNLVAFNPLKITALGFSEQEVPKEVNYQFIIDKLHPDDYESTMNAIHSHLKGKSTKYEVEHRIQTENGNWKWLLSIGRITQYSIDENPLLMSGMVFDITERKLAEIEINLQKKTLEAIIENMHDPLVIYNGKGNITLLNAEGRRLYPCFGMQNKASTIHTGCVYKDLNNNIIPYEDLPTLRAINGEKVRNERIIIENSEKSMVMEINATPIFDNENKIESVVVSHHDISKLISNQQEIGNQHNQLINIEKENIKDLKRVIEMKDEFLTLISHEFKTPLAVINLTIQTMESILENELTDEARRFLNKIRQNSNRQLKLVNNLLDHTRINTDNFKIKNVNCDIVSLTKSITESIYIYSDSKGIFLSFCSTLKKKVIGIDEDNFERVLLNLLSNAIKFTPKGKKVTVRLSQKIVNGKCKVSLQVKDTGIGIPSDKIDHIFEMFGQVDTSRTRPVEGTGIGLALVKKLVGLMGGEIWLESKVGVGSTFTIIFPIEKIIETPIEKMINAISDNRVVESVHIEFSDIN